MPIDSTYLYGLAAAVYVTTCIVLAAVRWFHMCRPYDRRPDYYYPGRPFVSGAWLSSVALLPYVLNPGSPDAWFIARLFFLPVTLFHFTLILFSYFGTVMQWKKWRGPTVITGIPVALGLIAAVVLALIPETQIGGTAFSEFLLYILGAIITGTCFASVAVVYIWAKRFDPDDFSNPADFPVTQARRWLFLILLNAALCWAGALLNSPAVLAVIQLTISASCVIFVISALHPHRSRPMEPEPAASTDTASAPKPLPKKKQAEILAAIRTVVEQEEAFLDSHLTLHDVAERCGYSRTYISGLVKSELGGFATYVNRLRLSYLDNYLKSNPGATLSEAIDASGFGSRQTYYAIKSRMD